MLACRDINTKEHQIDKLWQDNNKFEQHFCKITAKHQPVGPVTVYVCCWFDRNRSCSICDLELDGKEPYYELGKPPQICICVIILLRKNIPMRSELVESKSLYLLSTLMCKNSFHAQTHFCIQHI